jgi:hypothetical protein
MTNQCDYDTSFECTYHIQSKAFSEDDRDDAYRKDILRAFKLQAWDSDRIAGTLDNIFKKLRNIPGSDALLQRLRGKYPTAAIMCGDDERSLFQLLFSFDLFDKTHATICDLLEKGELDDEKLHALSENL